MSAEDVDRGKNSQNIIWVHEDALSRHSAVFKAAGPTATPIFIWDEIDFKTRGHSFKKLVFIYETLQDMDVEIIRGQTSDVLTTMCKEGGSLYCADTVNPEILALLAPIKDQIDVQIIKTPRLGDTEFTPDMKRFFRCWNKAKPHIMKPEDY